MPTKKSTASGKTVRDTGDVPTDLINFREAARLVNTSAQTLRLLARRGAFGSIYEDAADRRARFVSRAKVEDFLRLKIRPLSDQDKP